VIYDNSVDDRAPIVVLRSTDDSDTIKTEQKHD
jgi:hypothetical protein